MPHHTAANSAGDPSDFAIAAGVRKIPSAIDSPVTTAIVPANPICLRCSIEPTSYVARPQSASTKRLRQKENHEQALNIGAATQSITIHHKV
jgi:hypothetical protein